MLLGHVAQHVEQEHPGEGGQRVIASIHCGNQRRQQAGLAAGFQLCGHSGQLANRAVREKTSGVAG